MRVTGRDLDHVRRLKFDTAAGKAITIESAIGGRRGLIRRADWRACGGTVRRPPRSEAAQ